LILSRLQEPSGAVISTGIGFAGIIGSDTCMCKPPVKDPKLDPEVIVNELLLEVSRYSGNRLELGCPINVINKINSEKLI